MHAFILTTINRSLITQKLIELLKLEIDAAAFFHQPDVVLVEPQTSVTIAQIRNLQNRLSKKPLKLVKQIGIVMEAQLMTIPAQNAFLKLLEEPAANTIICLCLTNPYQLLPTILSRCQIIQTTDCSLPARFAARRAGEAGLQATGFKARSQELEQLLVKILKSGVGERLTLIEAYSQDRETTVNFCQQLIIFLEEKLHQSKSFLSLQKIGEILNKTLKLLQVLQANLNVKLSLDQWVLSL